MFGKLGRLIISRPWTVCASWVFIGLCLTILAPAWDANSIDDDVRFVPDRFTSVRAHQILEQAFPKDVSASRVIIALERDNQPLSDADFVLVDHLVKELEALCKDSPELKLGQIDSYEDGLLGIRLTSSDRHCTLIQVSLDTPYLAQATQLAVDQIEKRLREKLAMAGDVAPRMYVTGAAGMGRDLTRAARNSLDGTTYATIGLVLVVLLVVYRAPLLALIPLLTIGLSVWVAQDLLAMMTLVPGVHLVHTSKIFAIVILYGAGTDYCLFLISRYREELRKGHDQDTALARSVGGVGEALVASAATVMVGLGMMGLAEFAKVRCAGPAIALSLGVALVASLTLTPALLRLVGPWAFWPQGAPNRGYRLSNRRWISQSQGFWEWMSTKVVARPILIWSLAMMALMPLVVLGMKVQPNYRATGELSPKAQSLQGMSAIQRHFTAGEVGPLTILLAADRDWATPAGQIQISHLSQCCARLDNVAEVRSMTQPLGTELPTLSVDPEASGFLNRLFAYVHPFLEEFLEEIRAKSKGYYAATVRGEDGKSLRFVTRLDIVLNSDPFDPASVETLKVIQAYLGKELPQTNLLGTKIQAECAGVTTNAADLAEVTESDRVRVNLLVLGAVYLILFFLVRRPFVAAYLLATLLLSYFAALGATVLAGSLWSGNPMGQVDWRLPFFLFTLLVAVGADYNIFLITRATQERRAYGAVEGMRRALASTGGAITSCGLIMAGTFATLMLSGLSTLLQIGFALAVGVLIDTFIVRPFLVPAFAVVFWRDARNESRPVEEEEELEELEIAA